MPMKTALKKTKYITDRQGRRIGVVLPLAEYKKLLSDLEELDSIRAYDEALASGDKAIPFSQALKEIEFSRK
jgi:hypothetical protein